MFKLTVDLNVTGIEEERMPGQGGAMDVAPCS